MMTDAQLAAALIGTKHLPKGLDKVRALSQEGRAYQAMNPYPKWHFLSWMSEDRGPLPRCLPVAKRIVERGAKWLFGKPLQITVPGNSDLEEALKKAWTKNRMGSRLVAIAKDGALDGGVVLKFAYDEARDPAISFQSLSLVDECRLYYSPHDCDKLLMARVQYPYFDAAAGETYWYREEWTAAEEVHYEPLAATTLGTASPDNYDGWVIETRAKNPFGLIPLHLVKNLETDDVWGAADLWHPAEGNGLFRVIDRINLTYYLMDLSNQFDAKGNPIYIDLEMDDQDIDKPLVPGQPISAKSDNVEGTGSQGKVVFPDTTNGLRTAMMDYAKDLRKQVEGAASSVNVDQSEFTNKGNLTSAVLEQLYQAQIEITDEKRKSYGADGLGVFLSLAARGLQAAGVPLGVTEGDEDSYAVEIKFAPYFEMSQDEKAAFVGRLQEEETAGYLPHDRAIEEVSQVEGRQDVQAIKDELAAQPAPSPTAVDPSLQNEETEIKGLTKLGGDDSK